MIFFKYEKWEKQRDIKFNLSKVLQMKRDTKPVGFPNKSHGQILSPVKDAEYLGVDIIT